MRYLLDTDVVSGLVADTPAPRGLLTRMAGTPRRDIATSSVTIAELMRGAQRSRHRSEEFTERIRTIVLANFHILPFDAAAADEYGRLSAHLEARGTPIGDMDTLIAATALAYDLTVVTGNERHFGRVPGLEVENWIA